jgi:outer membrane protein assembly factor BamB
VDASGGAGRGVFLEQSGNLIFADKVAGSVYCHDVASTVRRWTLELPSRYGVAPIAIYRDQLVCFGPSALNYVDVATGAVVSQQRFPRIDKLYPPVEYEGDLLFAYTNWTSGGLIRFDPTRSEVKWKFTKRGNVSIPRGGPLPVVGRIAILSVNDGSSLVGVDLDSGEVRWTFRAQWLYTPVEVESGSLIFGTAGGHGRHLRRHDAATGETEWAVQMDGGCPYYSRQGDNLVAGDWSGMLRCVRRRDGEVVDEIQLGSPITTAPLVVGTNAFVLRWPTDESSPALVAIET